MPKAAKTTIVTLAAMTIATSAWSQTVYDNLAFVCKNQGYSAVGDCDCAVKEVLNSAGYQAHEKLMLVYSEVYVGNGGDHQQAIAAIQSSFNPPSYAETNVNAILSYMRNTARTCS